MPAKREEGYQVKSSIEYYDEEHTRENVEFVSPILKLERKPVGIKIFTNKTEYEKFPWNEPKANLAYCCYVEKATRGFRFKSRADKHYCDGGTTALSLEPTTNEIESGEVYYSYSLYESAAISRRVRSQVMSLHREETQNYGIAVGPLDAFPIRPDVIIVVGTPIQTMMIEQAFVYSTGEFLQYTTSAMQGVCSEVTVRPYLTGKINKTSLCPSTRFLAKWKEHEMAIGIPFEQFDSIVKGLRYIYSN